MKITEVYLKNFGKFHEERFTFHDGINLFYGENESGKTTIHTFIKCMLFGLERGRGRAATSDTFSQYEPWENSNYYAGVLRFETGGKKFCLTRSFDKYGKSASLVCEDDGEEFSLEQGDLETILPSLTAANYENTVAIGQMKVETNQSLAQELQNYATNYYSTGRDDIDFVGALESLTKQKKEVEKEIRNLDQLRAQQRRDVERDMSRLGDDIRQLEEKLSVVRRQIEEESSWERDLVEVAQEEVEKSTESKKPRKMRIYEILLLILGVILLINFVPSPWSYVASFVFAAGMIGLSKLRMKFQKKETYQEQPSTEMAADEDIVMKLVLQREIWEDELLEKQVKYANFQEELDELNEKDENYKQKERKREALELAMQKLSELSKETGQEISARLNKRVSEIVREITGGKYELLRADEDLKITLHTDGRMIHIEQVSRGTIEQIYFALRMAASELLHEEEYPVLLDDAFVYYDEKRLEHTLRWLKENKKQVLLFTCQKREGELLGIA